MAEIIAGKLPAAALSWRTWRLSKMRLGTKCILAVPLTFDGVDLLCFPITRSRAITRSPPISVNQR
jgi:hypothetical protein